MYRTDARELNILSPPRAKFQAIFYFPQDETGDFVFTGVQNDFGEPFDRILDRQVV